MLANGEPLSTTTYAGLWDAIGYEYGGSGSTFDLPNLSAADPKGAGSAGVNYYICVGGIFP
jgi:microcystin-dependent protein